MERSTNDELLGGESGIFDDRVMLLHSLSLDVNSLSHSLNVNLLLSLDVNLYSFSLDVNNVEA